MRKEKFSPQLMKSILQTDGIDTSSMEGGPVPEPEPLDQSKARTLTAQERKKALKQLASLISQFRSESGGRDELISFRLGELPNLLRFLAELATEAKAEDKSRKEKKKILRIAAAILRRMLHVPDASYYRVLGLNNGATPVQIVEHYQLLRKLFWFDEAIDPQRRSRLRISEAYTVLKDPGSRRQYDEELGEINQQMLHSASSGRRRGVWPVIAAALLVVLGLSGVFLYYGKNSDTNITSLSEKDTSSQQKEQAKADATSDDEVPVVADAKTQVPETTVQSVDENVSAPIEYVVEAEKHQVITEPFSDSADPLQLDVSPQMEGKAIDAHFGGEQVDGVQIAIKPKRKVDISAENAARTKAVTQSRIVSGEESKQIPEKKHNISKAEKSVPTEHDTAVSLVKPPVVQYPDTALVIPPRLDLPEVKKPSTTDRVERSSGQANISTSKASTSGSGNNIQPSMVVIGSPELSVDSLTREQVRAIFLGQKTRLTSGEQVTVVAPQGNGFLKTKFYREILGKTPRQLKIHWAKIRFQGKQQPLKHLVDDDAVKDLVAHSSGKIGIVKSTAVDGSIKVLFSSRP